MRVRAAPADALRLAPLDSLTAIYDRRSGQTHLIDAGLAALLSGDLDIDDAAELIAAGLVDPQ